MQPKRTRRDRNDRAGKGHVSIPVMAALLAAALNAQVEIKERPAGDAKPLTNAKSRPKSESEPQTDATETAQSEPVYSLGATVDPDLTLRDVRGRKHSFGAMRGKIVFLHFLSVDPEATLHAQSRLSALHHEFAGEDVVVLGIDANDREIGDRGARGRPFGRILSYVRKHKVRYPILVDRDHAIADRFRAKTTPHCYVLDRDGVVRYAGALDDDPRGRLGDNRENYVADAVRALLDGRDVNKFATRPYGRSIDRGKQRTA